MKAAKLHRVLEQAGPRGETGAGQVSGPGVVLPDRPQDVGVVDPSLVRDHQELVRDGELHVPPRVGEELGELRFLRGRPHDAGHEPPEELLGTIAGGVVIGSHDLRKGVKLFERMAFRDPLRAECDVNGAATSGEMLAEIAGRPRIDRASEDHE